MPDFNLPEINRLQKFVTPDEIKGEGVRKGFGKLCQVVTSKINRAGHALYQLATLQKPEWKTNDKIMGELRGLVKDLKKNCRELRDSSQTLTKPEQVKAAIKYSKALDKKLHELDSVISNLPEGLKPEATTFAKDLRTKINGLIQENNQFKDTLKTKIAKKIDPHSVTIDRSARRDGGTDKIKSMPLASLHKYVQTQGHGSPFLTRLTGAITGHGWLNNSKVLGVLTKETESLTKDIAKIRYAMDHSETVEMVERLQELHRNAQIKLEAMKTIADSISTESGSEQQDQKGDLQSQIRIQKKELATLEKELTIRNRLLDIGQNIQRLDDQQKALQPKNGVEDGFVAATHHQELKQLVSLQRELFTLTSFADRTGLFSNQGTGQEALSEEICNKSKALKDQLDEKINQYYDVLNPESLEDLIKDLSQELELANQLAPGYKKMAKYEAAAGQALAFLTAYEQDNPGINMLPESTEAFHVYQEATEKAKAARLEVEKEEHSQLQGFIEELETLRDGASFGIRKKEVGPDELRIWQKNFNELCNGVDQIHRRGYQKENEPLIKELQEKIDQFAPLANLIDGTLQLNAIKDQVENAESWAARNLVEPATKKSHFAHQRVLHSFTSTHLTDQLNAAKKLHNERFAGTFLEDKSIAFMSHIEKLRQDQFDKIKSLDASSQSVENMRLAITADSEGVEAKINSIVDDPTLYAHEKLEKLAPFANAGRAFEHIFLAVKLDKGAERTELKQLAETASNKLNTLYLTSVANLAEQAAVFDSLKAPMSFVKAFDEGLDHVVVDKDAKVWRFQEDFDKVKAERMRSELSSSLKVLKEGLNQLSDGSPERQIVDVAVEQAEQLLTDFNLALKDQQDMDKMRNQIDDLRSQLKDFKTTPPSAWALGNLRRELTDLQKQTHQRLDSEEISDWDVHYENLGILLEACKEIKVAPHQASQPQPPRAQERQYRTKQKKKV